MDAAEPMTSLLKHEEKRNLIKIKKATVTAVAESMSWVDRRVMNLC